MTENETRKGRAITIEQRKKAQTKRLAERLRANLRKRKQQVRLKKQITTKNQDNSA